jgi:hypothetical protein
MTATEPTADLFSELEADQDFDVAEYPDLTDAHAVTNCVGCGRLLLARRHYGERVPAFRVTDTDSLPPVAYRLVARGSECCACVVAGRRASRGRG